MRVSDLDIDRIYVNQAVRGADYRMVENHFHYYYEVFYVKQGFCRFFVNGSIYDLKAGDYMVVPPREVHYNRYYSQASRINIYFRLRDLIDNVLTGETPGDPSEILRNARLPDNVRRQLSQSCLVHIPSAHRSVFEGLLDSMMREDKIEDENTKRVLQLQLRQFFLYSVRYGIISHSDATRIADGDREIIDAARYISSSFYLPITLSSMADRAGLSQSYFSKRFRTVVGIGMKEYLTSVRLKHASIELLSTNHSVTEVAINNGFSDSNYFKDAFKKMYGVSPRAYRAAQSTDMIHQNTLSEDYSPETARSDAWDQAPRQEAGA